MLEIATQWEPLCLLKTTSYDTRQIFSMLVPPGAPMGSPPVIA